MPKHIYGPKNTPYWPYDFVVDGHRSHGSTRTTKLPEVRRYIDKLRAAAIAGTLEAKRPEMTVNAAFGRWHQERGRHLGERDNLMPRLARMLAFLGKDRHLSEIDGDVLSEYVAHARTDLSPAPVNHDLATLRRVLRKAKVWGVALPKADLPLGERRLPEPAPRRRYLSPEEETRLLAALPPDLSVMVAFALATGARLESVTRLRREDVDDEAGLLVLRDVKSTREGETHTLPVTSTVRALLGSRRGQHPEFVPTYLCEGDARPHRAAPRGRPEVSLPGHRLAQALEARARGRRCPRLPVPRYAAHRRDSAAAADRQPAPHPADARARGRQDHDPPRARPALGPRGGHGADVPEFSRRESRRGSCRDRPGFYVP
jgi:integrase